MTLLHEAADAKKLDTRMVERNVGRGVIKSTDVDSAVRALPDDGANAEWIAIESLADEGGGPRVRHSASSAPAHGGGMDDDSDDSSNES